MAWCASLLAVRFAVLAVPLARLACLLACLLRLLCLLAMLCCALLCLPCLLTQLHDLLRKAYMSFHILLFVMRTHIPCTQLPCSFPLPSVIAVVPYPWPKICGDIYIYMNICEHVNMYIYIYIYTYIHTACCLWPTSSGRRPWRGA